MNKYKELKNLYQIKLKKKEIKELNKLLNKKEQNHSKLLFLLFILGFLLGKITNLKSIIHFF